MINKLKKALNKAINLINKLQARNTYKPAYRITEIIKNDDMYIVCVQVIGKVITFNMKPEEILSNDNMVDLFSPRDIRTLTYLGYLGINSPQYTILAKRLSADNDKLIFALKKKGEKSIIVKTANEIIKEKEILDSLNPKDAQLIGYTLASESTVDEEKQKAKLIKQQNNQKG